MRAITAVLLLFVINITCNAQKLDGSWKGKMTGPNGEMNLLFTFLPHLIFFFQSCF